jgi:hypothetical protein
LQPWRIQNEVIDDLGNTSDTVISHQAQSLHLQVYQPHGHPVAAHPFTGTVRRCMLSPCVHQFREPRTDAHAQRRSREYIVPFCRHDWCTQVLEVPRDGSLRKRSHSALLLNNTITNQ